jgi:hypothetical protein
MFRRLMTVCWAAFLIAAATGLVGLGGYLYYTYEMVAADEVSEVPSVSTADRDGGEGKAQLQLSPWPNPNILIFIRIGATGGVLAGCLLLWNVLCHAGFWLWERSR